MLKISSDIKIKKMNKEMYFILSKNHHKENNFARLTLNQIYKKNYGSICNVSVPIELCNWHKYVWKKD